MGIAPLIPALRGTVMQAHAASRRALPCFHRSLSLMLHTLRVEPPRGNSTFGMPSLADRCHPSSIRRAIHLSSTLSWKVLLCPCEEQAHRRVPPHYLSGACSLSPHPPPGSGQASPPRKCERSPTALLPGSELPAHPHAIVPRHRRPGAPAPARVPGLPRG